MVANEDEKMPPLDILKIQKIQAKKAKKSRRTEFLKLFYSNPQRLLKLIKDLYDDNSISQQIKVNLYLQYETGVQLCFLIELCKMYKESVVRVMGTKVLPSEVRFQEDNEFMMRLKQSEGPLELMKELLDKNLKNELTMALDDYSIETAAKCKFYPIYHPYRKNIVLYVCLIDDMFDPRRQETLHGVVGECFRYCQEIILNTMRFDEQQLYHSKQKKILQAGVSNMNYIDDFSTFLPSLRNHILEILNAERCNIFMLDGKNLVSRIYDHGVLYDTFRKDINNVVIPVGVGIPGTVAETGQVINCFDSNNNLLCRKDYDMAVGLITRNRLCFPLLLYGRVYAVAEVFNKTNGYMFSGADVSHSENLGKIFGIQLYMSLLKKKNWDDNARRILVDSLMLETGKEIEEDELHFVANCTDEHKYDGFSDYMFIPSSIPEDHTICVSLYMFEQCNVLEKLDIAKNPFISFLLNVKNRQQELSFHGWQHGFNTLNFLYTIVKRENILENGKISMTECFCMFVAALCHDMEYGGPITPFMPSSGTTLGSLYSSPGSVVQIHSIAQTVRLLADCKITDEMDVEKFKEFLSLLDKMILDMDLQNHIYNRDDLKKLVDQKSLLHPAKNRRHYFALLLTCSDVSDFCKPWEYMETQGDKISQEFFAEEATKDCLGLIEFSELFDNVIVKKVMLQIHFIQTICEPAFSLLSSVFPRTDRCTESMEFNTRALVSKKDKIIQAQMEQT